MRAAYSLDITVAAVVERCDRFLLVEERVAGRTVFNQPAGHVEPHETFQEAVVRETLEEAGYRFHPSELVGIYLWEDIEAQRRYMRIAFTGTVLEPSDPVQLDKGIVGVHWLKYRELLRHDECIRSPAVLRCIDDYIAGKSYPLESLVQIVHEVDNAALQVSLAS